MPATLRIEVHLDGTCAHACEVQGPLELGRQRVGEPEPYHLLPATADQPQRLIVAGQQEGNVSRQHLLLEPLPADAVRLTNRSPVPLPLADGPVPAVAPAGVLELNAPFTLRLGRRAVLVGLGDSVDEQGLQGLSEHTVAPGSALARTATIPQLPGSQARLLDPLLGWLQTTLGVLQSAIGSADFLARAAEALVGIIGLTTGRVLRLDEHGWHAVACHPPGAPLGPPSSHVLERLRLERRTVWQNPAAAPAVGDTSSLRLVQTVVAAPVLAPDGRVVGALYGDRRREGGTPAPVGKLEALLVELLACGVATGLARQEQEQSALAARVRFEQFFTPELARTLARQPDLLDGRAAEVTLLFADVRGFSRISERLGPAATVRWMNEVMGELSRCVLDAGGVLVDYIGDELFAMWGAPEPQPDQARRAVHAGLAMLRTAAALNERWQAELGETMGLGVGINTGPAQVGNIGSAYKFKYGPLGHAVNLASRVQGLTKYLKCRLLVTQATRERLDEGYVSRRVCHVRVVNIQEPVALFEVEPAGDPGRAEFFRRAEFALDALEAGDYALAAHKSGILLLENPGDGPMLLTLSRAADQLAHGGRFDPVWEAPGK